MCKLSLWVDNTLQAITEIMTSQRRKGEMEGGGGEEYGGRGEKIAVYRPNEWFPPYWPQ